MNQCKFVMQARRWHGLMLGVLVIAMMHLSAATNAARDNEPWPVLLSDQPVSFDPSVAMLHRRAADSLDRLSQAAVVAGSL